MEQVNLRFEDGELGCDASVTDVDLLVVELVQSDDLLEREEVFGLKIAVEGPGHIFLGQLAFAMPELSQDVRVAFALENSLDDGHPGEPGDVREDGSEFDVHQLEGFLDVLDVGRTHFDEIIAMTDEGAQGADLRGRDERAAQQAVSVKLLDPLAIQNIGLLARDVFNVAGVDDEDFKAARFENFEDRDPVDAGGFHGHGIDLSGCEPIRESMEISGEGGERADGSIEAVLGDGGPNLLIADIETSRVEIDLLEGFERDDFAVTTFGMGLLGHDRILLMKLGWGPDPIKRTEK